ncbi:RDD family protein [Flavobacterium sp. HJ-32-4]|uniref:RDD family protein n=1 Tax=unclassified Flavobacterium TaxID=196869 RepID=UPI0035301845
MENSKAKRIYAFIFDVIISNFIGLLFFSIFDIDENITTGRLESIDANIRYGLSLQIVVFLLYNLTFDCINKGVTFGKLVFSIKVVRIESGDETAVLTRIVRTILKMISTIFLPVSALLYLYKGVTIHERFSRTKTIRYQKN